MLGSEPESKRARAAACCHDGGLEKLLCGVRLRILPMANGDVRYECEHHPTPPAQPPPSLSLFHLTHRRRHLRLHNNCVSETRKHKHQTQRFHFRRVRPLMPADRGLVRSMRILAACERGSF